MSTATGLDRLIRCASGPEAARPHWPGWGRLAVVCNATTLASDGRPTAEALARLPNVRLERICAPQHGFAAEKQDNMVPSAHGVHRNLRVPIVSLYGETRELRPDALDGVDLLLIDLQDVGTRVYTFLITALLAMRTARAAGVPVWLLDRPNPQMVGCDGPRLDPDFSSFVGLIDVPLQHDLTPAEYCLYGAQALELIDEADALALAEEARRAARAPADDAHGPVLSRDEWLGILPLHAWRRGMDYADADLLWTMPSPNMPALETARVYPGQVMLEGTNISEGRGTTRPFECFGAPYLEPPAVKTWLEHERDDQGAGPLSGVLLREIAFESTFHKYTGETVRGFQLHLLDTCRFRPVRFTAALIRTVHTMYPEAFAWRDPPYEYEYERMPIDVICGSDSFRAAVDAGATLAEITAPWTAGVHAFEEQIAPLRIYDPLGTL